MSNARPRDLSTFVQDAPSSSPSLADEADESLAKEAHYFLSRRHTGLNKDFAEALKSWLHTKKL